jgi:tetratricopeptide (TPR) repeat protein
VSPQRRRALLAALLLLASPACAKRVPLPTPDSEDYRFPLPAAGELAEQEQKALRSAWNALLAGDAALALRRLAKLERRGARPAVSTAIGFARLRARRAEEALPAFESALAQRPGYLPALVGAGSAAAARGDLDAALKLQVSERHLARAQAARDGGDADAAVREYEAVLDAAPELATVRLALAELLQQRGDAAGAESLLEADPTGDRQLRLELGALLQRQGELDAAAEVYAALVARDPGDAAARARLAAAREALEAAALPEEYRRIPEAPRVTRADLAALLMVRVEALRRAAPAGEPQVAVDIGGCWARDQIVSALALELMELYPNHTFQPGAVVRRIDVARAAARALDRLGWPRAAAAAPSDVPRSHLDYDAVQRALGSGLMTLSESGAFEPGRPVSGREALEVVDAIARLVGS